MALGTSCPLHNWVGREGGECLCPSGQGRAPTLRPRRQPQAMVGNAYSKQAGRVREVKSQAWVDPHHQVQQARPTATP